jgi:hypothetical protein
MGYVARMPKEIILYKKIYIGGGQLDMPTHKFGAYLQPVSKQIGQPVDQFSS